MSIEVKLSDYEFAMCVGALEHCAESLRGGFAAAMRLGVEDRGDLKEKAADMEALRLRLRAEAGLPNDR